MINRINCPSIHIFRQYYRTLFMHGIPRENNFPSGNIMKFVQSYHETNWHMYRRVQDVFNVHTIVSIDTKQYTYEIRLYEIKIFVRRVPSYTRWECISITLNNFSQQAPESITPLKKIFKNIRKVPKSDKEAKLSDPKQSNSHENE